jgi:hypothetical protein
MAVTKLDGTPISRLRLHQVALRAAHLAELIPGLHDAGIHPENFPVNLLGALEVAGKPAGPGPFHRFHDCTH